MRRLLLATTLMAVIGGCSSPGDVQASSTTTVAGSSTTSHAPVATTTSTTTTTTIATTTTTSRYARPDWLGTRLLPLRPDEFGEVQPTPPELQDRQLETIDLLPAPGDAEYHSTVGPIPESVLARSSWVADCPVAVEELSYLTMTHWGFDQRFHTGEMIVRSDVADDVVTVFRRLHESRFPIEQMRVVTKEEIDAHPTGDWNDTTSFVCRPAVGSSSWSQHALGTGIDVNPFHNPYVRDDLVLPELAGDYTDRSRDLPGMIVEGDAVTAAFDAIDWEWGGRWSSLKDYQHFSASGR